MSGYTYERKVPTAAQREARKAFKEADARREALAANARASPVP